MIWDSGTRTTQTFLPHLLGIVLFLAALVAVSGCSILGFEETEDPQKSANEKNAKNDLGDDGEEEGLFPHPKKPTAWNTRVLVLTKKLPEAAKIKGCQSQLELVSKVASNPDSLISAQSQTFIEIKQNQELYHWCFYQTMVDLDVSLENDNMKSSFQERSDKFYMKMKSLWLLARSLDQIDEGTKYFDYIRIRYIELSNEYFARNVDVLGKPLGTKATSGNDDFGDVMEVGGSSGSKGAGEADVDL